MSGLKRAVVVGVVCGCAATAWLLGHVGGTEMKGDGAPEVRAGRRPLPESRKGVSRFLPWSFALDVREGATLGHAERPDPYRGPRMTVTITVVDEDGQPVSGALVEARAYMEDYEIAGLTDDEYDVWAEGSDAAARAEEEEEIARAEGEGDVDGEYEEPEPEPDGAGEYNEYEDSMARVAVQSGRTDRKGTWQVELKPDAEIVFHARAGKREGVSATFSTWTRDDLEPAAADSGEQTDSGEENGEGEGDAEDYRGPREVVVEIAALAVLAGSVHDELGNPVANASIDLAPLSSDDESGYRDLEDLVVDDRGEPLAHASVQFSVREPGGGRGWGASTGADGASIDGRTVGDMDEWDLVALLDGPKGTRCRIVVERPATHQTVAVDLERVVPTSVY